MTPHPVFFSDTGSLRRWFEKNHDSATELWVGFYKKPTGRQNMTWSEAVDQALCFGWIDGIRKSVDEDGYTNRFTPRRSGSNWSDINIRKVKALKKAGLMTKAGLAAFEKRKPVRRPENTDLEAATAALMKKLTKTGAAFLASQTPTYRKYAARWISSAKKPETRADRIDKTVAACGRKERLNF
jgi:uncharacterized protein YdeI (YjbR/CyaY-like superfamily)